MGFSQVSRTPFTYTGLVPRIPADIASSCPNVISALRGSSSGKYSAGRYLGVKTFWSSPFGMTLALSFSMIPVARLVNALPQDASSGSASRSPRPK